MRERDSFKRELQDRLLAVKKHLNLSQSDMDKLLDIGRGSWQRYEAVGQVPGSMVIAALVDQGFNANWVLTGQGPMLLANHGGDIANELNELRDKIAILTHERDKLINEALDRRVHPDENSIVQVLGLAECGIKGWQTLSGTKMWVEAPAEITKDSGFATIAVGDSMRPEGIKEGNICFCDTKRAPKKGDIVFIERSDGTASIKLYVSEIERSGQEYVVVQGWLPADEAPEGVQKPFTWEILRSNIDRLAVVLYVKRAV